MTHPVFPQLGKLTAERVLPFKKDMRQPGAEPVHQWFRHLTRPKQRHQLREPDAGGAGKVKISSPTARETVCMRPATTG